MKKMRFSKRVFLNIFFAIVLAVILITIFFSYRQIDKISTSSQWVKHTYQVIESANNILLNVTEIESVTRGYLISGDTFLIENIDEKIQNIFKDFDLTKKLTKDNSQQQALLEKLKPLLDDRVNVIKESINLKLTNKLQGNSAFTVIHRAQYLTEKIKEVIKEIYNHEVLLLQEREETFLSEFNNTNIISNSVDVINICLLFIIIIFFNKILSDLIRSQNQTEQSEALLRGIIDGSNEYIGALDLNYNFLVFNEAFEREFHDIFGKHIAIGMNLKDSLAHLPEEQKKALDIWGRALKGEEFTIIEKFGSDEKSQNQYEITYSSIYNEQNQLIGASVISRDVGKRLEEENKLKDFNEKLEISLRQVENKAKEMTIVNDMNNELRSAVSLEETLSIISLHLKKILPLTSGIIYLMKNSRNYLEAVTEWNNPSLTEKIFSPDQCWGLRQGKIYFYINKNESIPCKHNGDDLHSYLCVPLLGLNEVIGILYLQITQSIDMHKSEIIKFYEQNNLIIQSIASQISLAISNIRLHEVLKARSTRDIITNLYNRSYLSDTFARDIQRAKRKKSSMAVIMMDLDFFKNINDTYGHEAGDIVLREIGRVLIDQLRITDIACRYGGEEFVIILYDTFLQEALEKIEKLRKTIVSLEFRFVNLVKITASFGMSMFPEDGEDADQLIKAADEAMYQSKKDGRNKITVYKSLGSNLDK